MFAIFLHDWCNKGCGMCYPVCRMVHIKEPLLLIEKSSPCGGSGFPLSLSEFELLVLPCTRLCRLSPPLLPPPTFSFFLFRTEELAKASTCARDRRVLQELALNVHVKHSDLT